MRSSFVRMALGGMMIVSGLGPALAAADPGHAITARVSGIRSARGSVVCRLFAGPAGFPKKGFIATQTVAVAGGSAECVFREVASGTYAVAVYHDENGNGRLDTNFLGIPSEGVGTSNNKRPAIGPPTWSASKFDARSDVVTNIALRY